MISLNLDVYHASGIFAFYYDIIISIYKLFEDESSALSILVFLYLRGLF